MNPKKRSSEQSGRAPRGRFPQQRGRGFGVYSYFPEQKGVNCCTLPKSLEYEHVRVQLMRESIDNGRQSCL